MASPSVTWSTKTAQITYRNLMTGAKEPGLWSARWEGTIVNTAGDGSKSRFVSKEIGSGSLDEANGTPSFSADFPITDDPDNSPQGGRVVVKFTIGTGGKNATEEFDVRPLLSWPSVVDLSNYVGPGILPGSPSMSLIGVPNGVASLGSDGKLNASQIPSGIGSGGGGIPALENVPAWGFGHSFLDPTGPGADTGGHALERVALRSRTQTMNNRAVGGTRSDATLSSIITNWVPNSRGVVFLAGVHRNDQNFYTNATPNYATVREIHRSMFAHLTSRLFQAYSTTSFSFGSGWSAGVSSTASSTADFAFVGDGAFLAFTAGSSGGVFTITNVATGTVLSTVTTSGYGVTFRGVKKVGGLGAGTHTVRVTVVSGTVTLVGALIPAATPPLIIWELEPPYNTALVSGGTLANTVSAAYQAASQTILSDFNQNMIVVVDYPPTWTPATDTLTTDGVHPSGSGHQKIADRAVANALAKPVVPVQGLNIMAGTSADPTTYTPPVIGGDTTAPTAPTAATVSSPAAGQILLTTSGATDAIGVVGYRLKSVGTSLGTISSSPGTINVAGATYGTLTVHAFDAAGNESTGFTPTPSSLVVAASTAWFLDTITGTDGTNLSAHTADTGQSWVISAKSTSQSPVTINSNRLIMLTATANGIYEVVTAPATADYLLEADLIFAGSSPWTGIAPGIGVRGGAQNNVVGGFGYQARFIGTSGIARIDYQPASGSATTILTPGSPPATPSAGSTHKLGLKVQGTTLTLYWDDVSLGTVTDSNLSAAGKIHIIHQGASTTGAGILMDNVRCTLV